MERAPNPPMVGIDAISTYVWNVWVEAAAILDQVSWEVWKRSGFENSSPIGSRRKSSRNRGSVLYEWSSSSSSSSSSSPPASSSSSSFYARLIMFDSGRFRASV